MTDETDRSADPLPPAARAANLSLWNAWTKVHETSAFYDVAGFKQGASSLWPLEREELGPFVHEGTSLLHLQCHFGLDTLSWARLGADVVGLDFSDEAIGLARRLADEVGLSGRASFVNCDLYAADEHLEGRRFDIVFVSWGAIEWLPDLERWAGIVARHLRPGGVFYMAEIHPLAYRLDEIPGEQALQVAYRYFSDEPDVDPIQGSYADRDADVGAQTGYSWPHPIGEIVSALVHAGLRIDRLREFPFSPAAFYEWMVQDADRWWWLPDGKGGRRADLPLSYSVLATRPA